MKPRSIAFLLAAAGLAAAASGQGITSPGVTATFSMDWIEDPAFAHNDNGFLEPAEHALIRTSFSFTSQYQWVDFAPAIGPYSRGIVVGLGGAIFDIRNTSAGPAGRFNNGVTIPPSASIGPDADAAGTTGYGIRAPLRIGGDGANGSLTADGFVNILPGQFVQSPSAIDPANPITNMDRLGWAPASYAPRMVSFSIFPGQGEGNQVGLILDLDGTTDGTQAGYVPGTVNAAAYLPLYRVTFGSVNIPVAPAPASVVLLGFVGLFAGRRSRTVRRTEGLG